MSLYVMRLQLRETRGSRDGFGFGSMLSPRFQSVHAKRADPNRQRVIGNVVDVRILRQECLWQDDGFAPASKERLDERRVRLAQW